MRVKRMEELDYSIIPRNPYQSVSGVILPKFANVKVVRIGQNEGLVGGLKMSVRAVDTATDNYWT